MKMAALSVAAVAVGLLLIGAFTGRLADENRADAHKEAKPQREPKVQKVADDQEMALIPAATFAMGIDEADLPRFQKMFQIDGKELFEAAMPKHLVTIDSFAID